MMAELSRPLKRKRTLADTPEAKLPGKLHHALHEVKKAARKAKTFETQKTVKKLKGLRKSDEKLGQVAELEKQLDMIKVAFATIPQNLRVKTENMRYQHLDLDNFSVFALQVKIKKDRVLLPNPVVEQFVQEQLAISAPIIEATSADGKVRNKLMSSRSFSSEMNSIISALRNILQPPQPGEEDEDEEDARSSPKQSKSRTKKSQKEAAEGGEQEEEDDDDNVAGWESGSLTSNPEVGDDGWESGSIENEESSNSGLEHSQVPSLAPSTPNTEFQRPSSSTFLPSLSVGFIRGTDSDGDLVDNEAKVADGVVKNRRGQRARQAIWEKKYGRGAKHLEKKRQVETKERAAERERRDQNRNARAHTKAAKYPLPTTGYGYASRSAAIAPASSTAPPPAKRAKREEKPLHPSWEAKKKLKEKQKAAIIPAQGNKIVF